MPTFYIFNVLARCVIRKTFSTRHSTKKLKRERTTNERTNRRFYMEFVGCFQHKFCTMECFKIKDIERLHCTALAKHNQY